MAYAYDRAIALPVQDLYDSQVMAMSINAAKDMYEKGQKQIEDFYNKYGDFISPIQKDMDWYAQNVTGKASNFINQLYANGIDPLRSAEGRAAVAQLVRSMPVGDIAKLRQSAETAKEYLKSMDDDTNPELEKFLGRDLSTWSTLDNPSTGSKGNGIWKANRASKYQTIDQLIEPIVKNVDYTFDEAMTKAHNDGNDYYSITKERLAKAIDDNMSDILATPSGAFHWDQAKKLAAAQGGGEQMAKAIFDNMISNRLSDHERTKKEVDQFKLDDYRTRNDMRAHAANKATDHYYWTLEHGGDDVEKYNRVFRRAEKLSNSNKKLAGDLVQYTPQEQYSQWIDPVHQGGQRNVKLESGEVVPSYVFSKDVMKQSGSIYKLGDDGQFYKSSVHTAKGDYTFVPDGNMRARYIGNVGNKKAYKYYISGMLLDPSARVVTNNGDNVTWIAVKERDHNYGQNQKKE